MKNAILIALLGLLSISAMAQKARTVKTSDLSGIWKLEMNIARLVREETRDEENALGRAIARGVSGFLESFTDDLDIRFTFRKGGVMDITTRYGNEPMEHDSGRWTINSSGQLVIDGDADHKVNFDSNDGWVMSDGSLHPLNDDGSMNRNIRLVRINR